MKKRARLNQAGRDARSVARLAAVQALYQMEVAGAGVDAVVREFGDHRFGREVEGHSLHDADEAFFAEVVRGVVADQGAIDGAIRKRLAANWKLDRLAATLRALLRCGAWELRARPDVPTEVVISEYVEIAAGYADEREVAFVNAALDGLGREARAA